MRDWVRWHGAYEDPASSLSARLRLVREHLADALSHAAPGSISLVSLCAGQGHDVTGALRDHPRRDDVRGVLVEADPANVRLAERRVAAAGLTQIEIRQADAGRAASFADALPAAVLLLCGIFGNVSAADIERTVTAAAGFTAEGGTVIWTRHRRPPDLTPQIRDWFGAAGFEEVAFDAPGKTTMTGVGVHRLRQAHPAPIPAGSLFTFTG
jgi:hypothetical protein